MLSGSWHDISPIIIHAVSNGSDTEITQVLSGGYYPYYLPPGELSLSAEANHKLMSDFSGKLGEINTTSSSVVIDVKPGETYYVKGSYKFDLPRPTPQLSIVDKIQGIGEVKKCRLLPSSQVTYLQTRDLAERGDTVRQNELAMLYMTGVNYSGGGITASRLRRGV